MNSVLPDSNSVVTCIVVGLKASLLLLESVSELANVDGTNVENISDVELNSAGGSTVISFGLETATTGRTVIIKLKLVVEVVVIVKLVFDGAF